MFATIKEASRWSTPPRTSSFGNGRPTKRAETPSNQPRQNFSAAAMFARQNQRPALLSHRSRGGTVMRAAVRLLTIFEETAQEIASSVDSNEPGRASSQAAVRGRPSRAVPSTVSRRRTALMGGGGWRLRPSAAARVATAPPSECPTSTTSAPPCLALTASMSSRVSATRRSTLRSASDSGVAQCVSPCPGKSAATMADRDRRESMARRAATSAHVSPTSPAPCRQKSTVSTRAALEPGGSHV
mmetsp:Transcript_29570/g.83351  ORF Transcript_29570/g.83351 Transcript_29570/m.83351 type:complete len:243 (-) Transcript_29570:101-829(-)